MENSKRDETPGSGQSPESIAAFVRFIDADDDATLSLREGRDTGSDSTAGESPREMEPHPNDAHSVSEPGTRVGNFTLIERISEGGFGVVWRAQQEEPVRREVALKILKPEMAGSAEMAARFRAEQQALALIEHPNVARVYDAGRLEDGRLYFAMELVGSGNEDGRTTPGQALTSYCDERKLGIRERLAIFAQVCRAIHHTHQRGFIHRDIKPSNLLVGESGGRPVPKVIDFGIAKDQGAKLNGETLFTQTGVLFGTPQYMSPEQAEGKPGGIDVRSDVYGLGAVLYELLCGEAPISRETLKRASIEEMLRIIREDEPMLPSARLGNATDKGATTKASARGLPETRKLMGMLRGEADWITHRALEKDPDRRYQSAEQLAEDVEAYVVGQPLPHAGPPSRVYRMKKFVRKHRGMVGAAVAIVLVLLCGIGMSVYFGINAERARDRAENARLAEVAQRHQAEKAQAEAERARDGAEKARLAEVEQRQKAEMARAAAELAKTEAMESKQKETEARAMADASRELAEIRLRESARTDLMIGKEWLKKGNHANAFAYLARAAENDPTLVSAMHTAAIELQSVPVNLPRAVLPHRSPVEGRFSDDGKRIVTVTGSDIHEWDFDGNPLRTIPKTSTENSDDLSEDVLGRSGSNTAVHPSGKFIASYHSLGGSVGTGDFSLFDVESNKVTWKGTPPSGGHILGEMKYSPDGKLLATGGLDGYIFECQTGALRDVIPHPSACRSVAFSPDSKVLATGGGEGTIRLYRTSDLSIIATLNDHKGMVEGLEFSGDGQLLLSYDSHEVGKVWKISERRMVSTISFKKYGTISRNGKWVATYEDFKPDLKQILKNGVLEWVTPPPGPGTGFVYVFRSETGTLHRAIPVEGKAKKVVFSPDSCSILITSTTGNVTLSNIDGASIGQVYNLAQRHPPTEVESALPRRYLLETVGSAIKEWKVIDRENSTIANSFNFRNGGIEDVCLSPEGNFVATIYFGNEAVEFRLCDAATGVTIHVLLVGKWKNGFEVGDLSFSKDGRRLVGDVAEIDSGTVYRWSGIWDTKSGNLVTKILHDSYPGTNRSNLDVLNLNLSGDGRFLTGIRHKYTEAENGNFCMLKVWNAETGGNVTTVDLGKGDWTATFSPDGSRLLVYDRDGAAKIFSVPSGELICTIKSSERALAWAWSPDGNFVAHVDTSQEKCLLTEWVVSELPAKQTMRIKWSAEGVTGDHRLRYSENGGFIIIYGRFPHWGAQVFDRESKRLIAAFDSAADTELQSTWRSLLPNAKEFAVAYGRSPEGDYLAELDHDQLRMWPWVGTSDNIPNWWPGFLRSIGGMGFNSEGDLAAIPSDSGKLDQMLTAIAKEKTPAAEFARLFLNPSKMIDISSLHSASLSDSASVKLTQADVASSNYAQSPGKENAGPPSKEISDPAAPILFLLEGRFGAIRLGMTEVEVRKALTEMGETHPGEMPFGRDGKLVSIDGINFRFTGDGKMFQIYALHESVGMESGLRLNHSTFAEFGVFLGDELKPEVTSNGEWSYYIPDSDLGILLIPAKDDPDRVFSLLLTKKSLD